MPNTLVHLGVQSVSTKALFKEADFKWIAIGCIIPDVPWIIKRIIIFSGLGIDFYDLTQYTIVQASLVFSLILCGTIALVCTSPYRIFLILALNAFIHLLLDAMQIKWANGVHFLAPFSWEMTNFNLLWPESEITYAFTAAGLAALVYFGVKDRNTNIVLTRKRFNYVTVVVLLTVYFLLPFWLRYGPDRADNHYTFTLRMVDERSGKYLELDRCHYSKKDNTVEIYPGERIKVTGKQPSYDTILSVKGRFTDNKIIHITEYHVHSPVRDASTKIAFAGVLLIWLVALWKKRILIAKDEHKYME